MTSRVFTFFSLSVLIFLLISCDNNRVFESYSPISKEGWNKDSLLNYSVLIEDSLTNYNFYLNVRNSVEYPYNNIWLFISITPPRGKTLSDTVEFTLADNSGKWFGDGIGKFRDSQLPYRNNVYFPDTGIYRFQIQQGMRRKILTGINDVGIRIEKTK